MSDLYTRLQQIRARRRQPGRAPAGDAGGERRRPQATADRPPRELAGPSPGPDWTEFAPGVYSRSTVEPIADPRISGMAGMVDADGRVCGASELLRAPTVGVPRFIDVETSALTAGAGSVAFLIGVGEFAWVGQTGENAGSAADPRTGAGTDGVGSVSGRGTASPAAVGEQAMRSDAPRAPRLVVRVRQLFLSNLAAEADLLSELDSELAGPDDLYLVTYNGGSFDLPVLRTRYIMNRRRFPERPHWDLLHVVRRLYAGVIGSCTLGNVERRVLGVRRRRDVPGNEVPERYHRFLETGEPRDILEVVEHHRYDVAHLGRLSLLLQAVASGAPASEAPRSDAPAATPRNLACPDRLGLARLLLQRGRGDEATLKRCAAILSEAIGETGERRRRALAAARSRGLTRTLPATPSRAWSDTREIAALVARRMGAVDRLLELRAELYEVRASRHDVVEYAKVLEHRVRDYERAERIVSERLRAHGPDAELEHRLERLTRKRARS